MERVNKSLLPETDEINNHILLWRNVAAVKECKICNRKDKLLRTCKKCRKYHFCSKKCQKIDWKQNEAHRKMCYST